jgi:gag-polyprotein putative aspartyl protease
MPAWQGLTSAADGLAAAIQTPCSVSPGFDPSALPAAQHLPHREFVAIWDTGATGSVISQKVVDDCGLKPIGMTIVHGVHGSEQAEQYLVNIGLPNGVVFVNLTATKGKLGDAHVLIGMDIILSGDFVITNKDGKTVMSFRTPSQECVDFVKEHQRLSANERFQHGGSKHERKKSQRLTEATSTRNNPLRRVFVSGVRYAGITDATNYGILK